MYNIGYQLVAPVPGQLPFPGTAMNDRALINQRLQALMNMSCLRMRGLPFSASHKDILNFLGSYKENVVGNVHIIYNLQVNLGSIYNLINFYIRKKCTRKKSPLELKLRFVVKVLLLKLHYSKNTDIWAKNEKNCFRTHFIANFILFHLI